MRRFFYIIFILPFFVFSFPVYALPGAHSYTNNTTGDVFLGGNYIEVGISRYGSFGTSTGQSKPSGFYGTAARNNIGMSSNAAGFDNSPDTRIDYFLPGTPEERWVVGYKVAGSPSIGSNSLLRSSTNISDNTVVNESTGDTLKATSVGTFNSRLKVTQVITFSVNDKYFKNTVTLQNVHSSAIDSVRYMRTFDPDNTVDKGGQSATRSQILYTFVAGDEKAVVMSDTSNNNSDPVFTTNGSRSPILFYTSDTRARVSTFGFSNTDPYASAAYDSASAKGTAVTADQAITITVDAGTLAAGASTNFVYYTSLDNRDFSEVIEEIEEEAANATPNAPTALGPTARVNGSAVTATQPNFTFTLSDDDVGNTVKYRLQVDDSANFASPVIDYTSALGSQGSFTFTVGQNTSGGTYTTGSSGQTLSDGSYYWRVKTIDSADAESSYSTANSGSIAFILNTETPQVSNISTTTASTSATIQWSTSEQTSSKVDYGLVPVYGFSTSETDTSPRVTNHSVTIPNLKQCARYFYRVKSKNNAGTETISDQKTFSTTGCETASIKTGTESLISHSTGGSVSLTNNRSEVTLTIPTGYAGQEASFQINRLNTESVTTPPGKNLADENIFDLIAVDDTDTELTSFSSPITFTIAYGSNVESSFKENTLDVYYYDNGTWTPLSCTLDTGANTLTCTLHHFSTYGVFGDAQSSGSSSIAESTPPGCTALSPIGSIDLYEIRTIKDTATLYFTPVNDNISSYFISFSMYPDQYQFGVEFPMNYSSGAVEYTLNSLPLNTALYIKVRAGNGCAIGTWSNMMKIQTSSGKKQNVFFK